MKELDTVPKEISGVHDDLIGALAQLGVNASQIKTRFGDVYVMCRNQVEASRVKQAGTWKSMAEIARTNPDHPDAKEFPYLVDIPFANLSGYLGSAIWKHKQ